MPSLHHFRDLLADWLEHWTEVERLQRAFPPEAAAAVERLPSNPTNALMAARMEFARSFHPEAVTSFIDRLRAAELAVESLLDRQSGGEPSRPESLLADLNDRVSALEAVISGAGAVLRSVHRPEVIEHPDSAWPELTESPGLPEGTV